MGYSADSIFDEFEAADFIHLLDFFEKANGPVGVPGRLAALVGVRGLR